MEAFFLYVVVVFTAHHIFNLRKTYNLGTFQWKFNTQLGMLLETCCTWSFFYLSLPLFLFFYPPILLFSYCFFSYCLSSVICILLPFFTIPFAFFRKTSFSGRVLSSQTIHISLQSFCNWLLSLRAFLVLQFWFCITKEMPVYLQCCEKSIHQASPSYAQIAIKNTITQKKLLIGILGSSIEKKNLPYMQIPIF